MRNRLNRYTGKTSGEPKGRIGDKMNVANKHLKKSQIALCVASLCITTVAGANPTGEQVVHGIVNFDRHENALTIQNSNGAIINWQDFSIAQDEAVRFLQNSSNSSVLNRVVSGIPSEILGSLSSNGRVFLINPNGLVMGEGATIDTASFIASTLNISDKDFLDGNLKFSGDSGKIENHGYIAAGPNGEVILLAPTVENHGLIKADDGRIILAAGREVTLHSLNEGGVSFRVSAPADSVLNIGELVATNGAVKVFADQIFQEGSISANRAYRNAEGSIVLEADDTLNVSGDITVSGEGVDAGSIHLLGAQIDVEGANIDASGESGGEILIGGDYQGNGTVKNAENTNVDEDTVITADAGKNGDGGRVIIWSDDTTNSFGKITARGGSVSGDGGFVETSGKKTLNFGQAVDASATNGAAGTWLLDPEDITIGESEAESIETSLNGGSNVEVKTSDEGDGEGNIYVNSSITKTEGDSEVTLTLDAHNRVEVNAPISTTAGPLNVTIKTGRQVAAVDTTAEEDAVPNDDSDNVVSDEQPDESTPEENGGNDSQDGEVAVQDNETGDEVEGDTESPDSVESGEGDDDSPSEETSGADAVATNEEADALPDDNQDSEDGDQTPSEESNQVDDVIEQDQVADVDEGSQDDASDTTASDTTASDTTASDTTASDTTASDTTASDTTASDTTASDATASDATASDATASDATASDETTDEVDDAAEVATQQVNLDNDATATTADIEDTTATPTDASQLDGFSNAGEQQIIIAADIFTGGGDVQLDSGAEGDTIIGSDIVTADAAGDNAGDIKIEGERIAVVDDASVDASANNAGDIKIGGGLQGQDDSVRNADVALISEGTTVRADGGETGDGGEVIVFSEQSSVISGNLSARGGTQSGNGGFIETSGLESLTIDGTPNVGANNGNGGEWLIDPHNILILQEGDFQQSNVDQVDTSMPPLRSFEPILNATNDSAVVGLDNILEGLRYGDVTVSTTNGGSTGTEQGNITVTASYGPITISSGASYDYAGTLTLNADNNILFEAAVDIRDQGGPYARNVSFDFNAGGDIEFTPYSGTDIFLNGDIDLNAGGNITLNHNIAESNNVILTTTGTGNIAVNGDLNTSSNLTINSGGGVSVDEITMGSLPENTLNVGGVTVIDAAGNVDLTKDILSSTSLSITSTNGNITTNQRAGTPLTLQSIGKVDLTADNGNISLDSFIRSDGSSIAIEATGGRVLNTGQLDANFGVDVTAGQSINVDGNITSTGTMPTGDITLDAGTDIDVNGDLSADNVLIDAELGDIDLMSGSTDIMGHLTVDAGDKVDVGQNLFVDELDISAGASGVTLNGEVGSRGDITITTTSGGSLDINKITTGMPTALENTLGASGSIDLGIDGDIAIDRNISAGTFLNASAGNDLKLDTSRVTARSYVNLISDSDGNDSGSVLINNVYVGGIGRDITIQGAGVTINSSGCQGPCLNSSTSIGTTDLSIISTGANDINISSTADMGLPVYGGGTGLYATGDLIVTSGGNVNIDTADSSTDAGISGQRFTSPNVALMTAPDNFIRISALGSQTFTADNMSITTGAGFTGSSVEIHGGGLMQSGPVNQTFNVNNLTIDGSQHSDNSGIISIDATGTQEINVGQNLTISGSSNNSYNPVLGYRADRSTNYSNVVISSSSAQMIEVGGKLELNSAEIVSTTARLFSFGPPILANAESSIRTGDLVVNNGRIALEREMANDTSTFVLTTTGANSTIDGIMNPTSPEDYALNLNGVKWDNSGTVRWNSGAVIISNQNYVVSDPGVLDKVPAKILTPSETLFVNQGRLELNSESGSFDMVLYDGTGSEIGVGGLLNTGEIAKAVGGGLTNANMNVQSSGTIAVESGTLDFGPNTITQSGANSELVIAGGNFAATGGTINVLGGVIRGGVDGSEATQGGGTIRGNLNVTNTSIEPGFSPGQLTVDGNLDASGGGNTFVFEIDAETGLSDQLIVTGDANLDGVDNAIEVNQFGLFNTDPTTAIDTGFTAIDAGTLSLGDTPITFSQADGSVAVASAVSATDFTVAYTREAQAPEIETPAPDVVPEEPVEEVVVEEDPLEIPDDIVDLIVNIEEDVDDEREEDEKDREEELYAESKDEERSIKANNMCVAKA